MSARTLQLAALGAILAGSLSAQAQTASIQLAPSHKEFRFNVEAHAALTVNNPYGSISVKPSNGNIVVITAALASDKVEVDNSLTGNRVEIQSHLLDGADMQSGRVDYDILVPADASISLNSSTGPLRAERLHGDVTLVGAAATVEVHDISGGHLHVKTLNGPVTLTNVQNGHVEVDSLSGDVTLNGVTGPLLQVISTSGGIHYIGDFGERGEYRLTSHSGDIDATVPDSTSADVNARSVRGEVRDEIPLQPRTHTWFVVTEGRAFWGTMGQAAVSSSVVLRSFSGKIHLRKRTGKQSN